MCIISIGVIGLALDRLMMLLEARVRASLG
jgi:ABC-type nitrate/sulfonate/bicarbonate transport system permease component